MLGFKASSPHLQSSSERYKARAEFGRDNWGYRTSGVLLRRTWLKGYPDPDLCEGSTAKVRLVVITYAEASPKGCLDAPRMRRCCS